MGAAYDASLRVGLIDTDHSILGDFLGVTPFLVDAVIGNPPYVRLRSLPPVQKENARRVTARALGLPMDTGSVWMAFVLHATRFLLRGGRFAFVLPYEVTHVRYAKPLWRFLGSNFGSLRVVRVKERLFPELMQEVVIMFADDKGTSTGEVCFEAYETTRDLVAGTPMIKKQLSISAVIRGRPFVQALLPDELVDLMQDRIRPLTPTVSEFCKFNIGYVSGHKRFFHPDQRTIARFMLPQASLRNSLVASRDLRHVGLRTSSIQPENLHKLFYPNGNLSPSEEEYILQGERDRIHSGYKCSNRTPWYRVPDVRVPDLMLSVFKEVPSLIFNDGDLVASNSILCGFICEPHAAEQFVAAWYTSLTLLYCELEVHSLGGGVLVLIPGEVSKVRIPSLGSLPVAHLDILDKALVRNSNPYPIGDEPILRGFLGLTAAELSLIRDGVALLGEWRKTYQRQSRRRGQYQLNTSRKTWR